VARATGGAVNATAARASDLNQKHDITGKTKQAVKAGAEEAAKLNEQYSITDKLKGMVKWTAKESKELNDKHNLTGKAADATISGMHAITDAMKNDKVEIKN